jgi:DNA-binding transcriptional ArsR family regulator
MNARRSSTAASKKNLRSEEALDATFFALSDRTRRALLARLAHGPMRVTDLAAPFDMSLPAVSKHLRVLEQAGLIVRAIDGRVHTCSLRAVPLEKIEKWIEKTRGFWEGTLDSLARYVESDR